MERKDIFISYKSEEFDEAYWVKTTLENNGFSCWMAPMCIPGGSSYAVEIPTAIRQCKIFVLILSDRTQLSKWVPRELDQAINESKIVMPFMLENCNLKDDFNFYLSNVQRYEAYKNKSKTIEKMISEIRAILNRDELSSPSSENDGQDKPESPPNPDSQEEPKVISKEPARAKKEKRRKTIKQKPQKNQKKNKKRILVAASIVLLISLLLCFIWSSKNTETVTIADLSFDKDEWYIEIEDKTLTSADLDALMEFEKSLSSLYFRNCTFDTSDLSNISALELYTLELFNCNLTDDLLKTINFENQKKLTRLNLGSNSNITDLTPIATLQDNLTELNISDSSITDISCLESFNNLKILRADNLGLNDLQVLKGAIYLEELHVRGNNITDLNGLENTTLLHTVDLSDNAISDVSILKNSASSLKKLSLNNNKISDLSPLSSCTLLTHVSVNNNAIQSLSNFTNCKELMQLSASGNQISSVTGLAQCEQLSYLDLSYNQLTQIEESALCFKEGGYINVNLSNNKITEIYLPSNCNYSWLSLHENDILNVGYLKNLTGSEVYIDFPEDNTDSLNDLQFYYYNLVDCPLNQRVTLEKMLTSVNFLTSEEANQAISEKVSDIFK